MKAASLQALFAALEAAHVKYLIAGGLAVNAHGYLRFTMDADIAIELLPENIERAFAALASVGYRPSVPVSGAEFCNAETRARWMHEKGMRVLQFWSDAHRETPVDVFVTLPFEFSVEYAASLVKELRDVGMVRFVSYPTLIRMKLEAGRESDRLDIIELRKLHESREKGQ